MTVTASSSSALGGHRVGCHGRRGQAGEVPRRLSQCAAAPPRRRRRPRRAARSAHGVPGRAAGRGPSPGRPRRRRRHRRAPRPAPPGRPRGPRPRRRARPDPAPAGGGVEQRPVGRGRRRGHPGRPRRPSRCRRRARGRPPSMAPITSPSRQACSASIRVGRRSARSARSLIGPSCRVIGIPLRCLSTMLAGVGGSEYVSVHARTGYLATQPGRAQGQPGPGHATQPGPSSGQSHAGRPGCPRSCARRPGRRPSSPGRASGSRRAAASAPAPRRPPAAARGAGASGASPSRAAAARAGVAEQPLGRRRRRRPAASTAPRPQRAEQPQLGELVRAGEDPLDLAGQRAAAGAAVAGAQHARPARAAPSGP